MILPPYGLSGGLMLFEPASLVLFVDDSLDEIQAILSGGFETPNSPIGAIRLRSRLVHERDHFFRHLSTSYGFVRHGLHSLMVRLFFRMVAMSKSGVVPTILGLIGSDLRKLLRQSPPPAVLGQLLQIDRLRPTLMYLANLEFILALDGKDAFLDRALLSNGIAGWESIAQSLSGRSQEGLRHFRLDLSPLERLTPFVDPRDPFVPLVKGEPFGAVHLMEFFGVLVEFAYLSSQGVDLIESSDLLGASEYYRVSSAFFGDFFQDEMRDGRFPAFPVELEAAADLALCMPISNYGIRTADRPLSWFDIHPGWRFLQICDYYKTRNQSWTHISALDDSFDNYDDAVRQIQIDACSALGWPTVDRVESDWRAFLENLKTNSLQHPFCLNLRGSGRQRIGRHLFAERTRSPYSMYLKRRSGAVDRELFFPAAMSREGMTAFGGLHWTDSESQPVNWDEYLVFTGCRFFAEGATLHTQMRYEHAAGAAELLSRCAPMFGGDQDKVERVLADYLNLESYHRYERDITKKP